MKPTLYCKRRSIQILVRLVEAKNKHHILFTILFCASKDALTTHHGREVVAYGYATYL